MPESEIDGESPDVERHQSQRGNLLKSKLRRSRNQRGSPVPESTTILESQTDSKAPLHTEQNQISSKKPMFSNNRTREQLRLNMPKVEQQQTFGYTAYSSVEERDPLACDSQVSQSINSRRSRRDREQRASTRFV